MDCVAQCIFDSGRTKDKFMFSPLEKLSFIHKCFLPHCNHIPNIFVTMPCRSYYSYQIFKLVTFLNQLSLTNNYNLDCCSSLTQYVVLILSFMPDLCVNLLRLSDKPSNLH